MSVCLFYLYYKTTRCVLRGSVSGLNFDRWKSKKYVNDCDDICDERGVLEADRNKENCKNEGICGQFLSFTRVS